MNKALRDMARLGLIRLYRPTTRGSKYRFDIHPADVKELEYERCRVVDDVQREFELSRAETTTHSAGKAPRSGLATSARLKSIVKRNGRQPHESATA